MELNDTLEKINSDGFVVIPQFLQADETDSLADALTSWLAPVSGESKLHRFARRNLLRDEPLIQNLASGDKCQSLAKAILGPKARPVKATLFDKNQRGNWKVPAHQDVTITVRERVETEGYGPWTLKAGIHNVQPPIGILKAMIAFRIHLDDTDDTNGALRVWPGSHAGGRLRDAGITQWLASHSHVTCNVPKGGIMLMNPLLLHASSKAATPTHRRVIHIEYAACNLPNGLNWLDFTQTP